MQAIGEEELKRAQLFSVEDYSRFIPSMSYMGNSSGAGKVFFRGVADAPDTFIAQSSAAVYLDEQPLTQSAQVDVRLIDIERVEALSGPQGTLFGSSSQSGTLRIVTNKPTPDQFEAFIDVTGSGSSEGDPSYDISGMVNIPVNDNFAVRLVGFSAKQGGFIDNVLGQTPGSENGGRTSINGVHLNDGTVGGVQVFDSVVEDDWNEQTIDGGRIAAKWDVTDNLSMTAQIASRMSTPMQKAPTMQHRVILKRCNSSPTCEKTSGRSTPLPSRPIWVGRTLSRRPRTSRETASISKTPPVTRPTSEVSVTTPQRLTTSTASSPLA